MEVAYSQVGAMKRRQPDRGGDRGGDRARPFARLLAPGDPPHPPLHRGRAASWRRDSSGSRSRRRRRTRSASWPGPSTTCSAQLAGVRPGDAAPLRGLEHGYLDTIVALANAIDSKDPYTRGHSQRVGDVAVEIGRELGLTERELKRLRATAASSTTSARSASPRPSSASRAGSRDEEFAVMQDPLGDRRRRSLQPMQFLEPRARRDPQPPRAVGRQGLPRRAGRRGHPAHRPDRQRRGHLRRLHLAPAPTRRPCRWRRRWRYGEAARRAARSSVVDALRRVLEKRGVRLEGRSQPVKLAS